MGLNKVNPKLDNKAITSETSVTAGEVATLTGTIETYSVPESIKLDSAIGTTAYITDPIIYLTLPIGMSVESEKLGFTTKIGTTSTQLTHTLENVSYLNTTGDGVSIYKITFPENTPLGYYTTEGLLVTINYTIPLRTSKSLATQPYFVNDGSLPSALPDKYNLNGGKDIYGFCSDDMIKNNRISFGVQQQAEINVYNAVSVTKINGQSVPEKWYAYDVSDPNSIAMLGRSSEGRLRLQVSNTSNTSGSDFAMVLPLPKTGLDLGNVFMENAPEFDLAMTYDSTDSNNGFEVKYIKLNGISDTIPADGIDKISYTEVPQAQANAVLITSSSITRGDYYLYLDFTLEGGIPDNTDIWRPAYSYTVGAERRAEHYGSYVASAVAGSGISGVVWNDANCNSRRDTGEVGVSGITVVAKDEQNRILSTTTDANGAYEFLAVRESEIELSFNTDGSKDLRFNVQPLVDAAASTVVPAADGLSAEKSFVAAGDVRVNAAMSGFITLDYNANGATGNLPKKAEYVSGAVCTVDTQGGIHSNI